MRRSAFGLVAMSLIFPGQAIAADKVRISSLADVSFGTLTNFTTDVVRTENICVYAKSPPAYLYRVTATGSGSGGAFTLNSGSSTLTYEVQWNSSSGQSSGSTLSPAQPLVAQPSTAAADDCSVGPATTASLILVLRSASLGAAVSGVYNGSLSLLIAPE